MKKTKKNQNDVLERFRKTWIYPFVLILVISFAAIGIERTAVLEAKDNAPASQEVIETKGQEEQSLLGKKVAPKKTIQKTELVEKQVVTETVTRNDAPEVEKKETAKVEIEGVGVFIIKIESGDTAFDILKKASKEKGFPLGYQTSSYGVFVTKIGQKEMQGSYYWSLYYNGAYAQVGADAQKVYNGDVTKWRYESWM